VAAALSGAFSIYRALPAVAASACYHIPEKKKRPPSIDPNRSLTQYKVSTLLPEVLNGKSGARRDIP